MLYIDETVWYYSLIKSKGVVMEITLDQFEDILYSNEKTVVQKEFAGNLEHTTVLYVFENDKVVATYQRIITAEGVTYEQI